MKILSFGEILFDIIEDEPHLGGAPLNFAAHITQCGGASYILSRVGTDALGNQAIQKIEALGVNTVFIQKDALHATGTVDVILDTGQPDYFIHENVAYDYIDFDALRGEISNHAFDVLYFGTLAQRNKISEHALTKVIAENRFRHVFYDINLRKNSYNRLIIQNSLQHCTILKLNEEELHVVSQMFYQTLLTKEVLVDQLIRDFKIETVVVTAGDKGCHVYQPGTSTFIKAYPVQVIDAIGAGDAFSAAFVVEYLKHGNVEKSGEIASRLGSFVAGSRGAIPAYPPEIKKMLGLL